MAKEKREHYEKIIKKEKDGVTILFFHPVKKSVKVSWEEFNEVYEIRENEPFKAYMKKEYSEKVKECEECLFKIESSKINTMEILFEAEEIEKISSQAEEKYNDMLKQGEKDSIEEIVIDKETKALLNNPEDIIKMLKKKRGI